MLNKTALSSLTSAQKSNARFEAILLEFDTEGNKEKVAWQFLINPKDLNFSESAEYSKVSPIASPVRFRRYVASTGATLKINDMIMDTFCLGKSLKPLIDGARVLMKAKVDNDEFTPIVLAFKMGSKLFAPCVLTELTWVESRHLSGEPARISMSMTLEEIPKPLSKSELAAREKKKQNVISDRNEADGKPRKELTPRQVIEATNVAKKYLKENIKLLSAELQGNINRNKVFYQVDKKTGDVSILSGDTAIGVVLRSLGEKIVANPKVTSIPTLPNTVLPILK